MDPVPDIRAVDLVPTIARLMVLPGPINARGKILSNLFLFSGTMGEWVLE